MRHHEKPISTVQQDNDNDSGLPAPPSNQAGKMVIVS